MAAAHPMLRMLFLRNCFTGPRYSEDLNDQRSTIEPEHFAKLGALCPRLESFEFGAAAWLTAAHLEALLCQPRYPGEEQEGEDDSLDMGPAKWNQVEIRGAGLESQSDVEQAIRAIGHYCPELHKFTLTYNEHIHDQHVEALVGSCRPEVVDLSVCHNLTPRTVELLANHQIFSLAAQYCKWLTDSGIEYMVDKIIECGGFNIGTFAEFKLSSTAVTTQGLRRVLKKVAQHTDLSDIYSGLRIYQSKYLIDPQEEHVANSMFHSVTHSAEAKAWRALAADFGSVVDFWESDHIIS